MKRIDKLLPAIYIPSEKQLIQTNSFRQLKEVLKDERPRVSENDFVLGTNSMFYRWHRLENLIRQTILGLSEEELEKHFPYFSNEELKKHFPYFSEEKLKKHFPSDPRSDSRKNFLVNQISVLQFCGWKKLNCPDFSQQEPFLIFTKDNLIAFMSWLYNKGDLGENTVDYHTKDFDHFCLNYGLSMENPIRIKNFHALRFLCTLSRLIMSEHPLFGPQEQKLGFECSIVTNPTEKMFIIGVEDTEDETEYQNSINFITNRLTQIKKIHSEVILEGNPMQNREELPEEEIRLMMDIGRIQAYLNQKRLGNFFQDVNTPFFPGKSIIQYKTVSPQVKLPSEINALIESAYRYLKIQLSEGKTSLSLYPVYPASIPLGSYKLICRESYNFIQALWQKNIYIDSTGTSSLAYDNQLTSKTLVDEFFERLSKRLQPFLQQIGTEAKNRLEAFLSQEKSSIQKELFELEDRESINIIKSQAPNLSPPIHIKEINFFSSHNKKRQPDSQLEGHGKRQKNILYPLLQTARKWKDLLQEFKRALDDHIVAWRDLQLAEEILLFEDLITQDIENFSHEEKFQKYYIDCEKMSQWAIAVLKTKEDYTEAKWNKIIDKIYQDCGFSKIPEKTKHSQNFTS